MALTLTCPNSICKPRWLLLAALPVFFVGVLSGFLATRGHTQEPPANTDSTQQPAPKDHTPQETKTPQPVRANLDGPKNNPAPAGSQKWEYKVLALQPLDARKPGVAVDYEKQANRYTEEFNKLGRDGWEYHSTPVSVPGGIPGDFAIFRRPLQQQ